MVQEVTSDALVPVSAAPLTLPDTFCSAQGTLICIRTYGERGNQVSGLEVFFCLIWIVSPPSPAATYIASPDPPIYDSASHFASSPTKPSSPLGTFRIVSQPGPKSFLKNSKTEKPEFDVQLCLAPGVRFVDI